MSRTSAIPEIVIDSQDGLQIVIDSPAPPRAFAVSVNLLPTITLPESSSSSSIELISTSSHERSHHSPLKSERDDYQHKRWYEVENMQVKASALHSPRIRAPATDADSMQARRTPKKEKHAHLHAKRQHFNDVEDWENKEEANFSYQSLGDEDQKQEFLRVLRRLFRCKYLSLMHNSLSSLKGISFKVCISINLTGNNFASFKDLPHLPLVEELNVQDNQIETLDGLRALSSLRSLVLVGNPITFTDGYRARIFKVLPCLELLDGLSMQPDDEPVIEAKGCRIS